MDAYLKLSKNNILYNLIKLKQLVKLDEIKEKMIMGIASSRSQVVWGTMENKGKEISYNVYDKDSGKTASFDIFKITDDLTFPNNMNEIMLLGLLPLRICFKMIKKIY